MSGPRPEGLNARDIAMLATEAFAGETPAMAKRLRYALTYSVTAGGHTSAKDLNGEQLHQVRDCLVDIIEGRLRWSADDEGVTFEADGFGVTVQWECLDHPAVAW